MIAILGVLMLPAVATITPLYILLNQFQIEFGDLAFNLRASLIGVSLAIVSVAAAVRDLEPQGLPRHDPQGPRGGGRRRRRDAEPDLHQGRPAAGHPGHRGHRLPGLPRRLDRVPRHVHVPQRPTCRTGPCRSPSTAWSASSRATTPWSEFAAFAILFALPVSVVFFFFQRYLVGGLAVGGVKG